MAAMTTSAYDQDPQQEEFISTFFVRALYDYQSDDPSSLSFHRGDIIEVLTRLESGWWDGLLREERGWFPSNYVKTLEPSELEALSESDGPQSDAALADDSVVDMAQALAGQSDSESEWMGAAVDPRAVVEQPVRTNAGGTGVQSDFWVPQVTGDGQVFYVNTKTGQRARDLPQEADSDLSDSDVAGLAAQQRARAGTTSSLGLAALAGEKYGNGSADPAGFGIAKRSGTPEPWVKRLADDGMTYYYLNTLDNSVSWTPPYSQSSAGEPSQPRNGAESKPVANYYGQDAGLRPEDDMLASAGYVNGHDGVFHATRLRSDSSASALRGNYAASVYSDDSDVVPIQQRERAISTSAPDAPNPRKPANGRPFVRDVIQLTSAEQAAKALQQDLLPPPAETVDSLASKAREAITAAVESTKLRGRPDMETEIEARVDAVVLAVRNLLYITALPSGSLPASLQSQDIGDIRPNATSQSVQTQLKPAQRKVTATLSKLVLSARAVYFDSVSSSSNSPGRLEGDAAELDKAVLSFLQEVKRCQERYPALGAKRVHGVYSATHLGLGMIGGGAAASWKGFGWVGLDESADTPGRILGTEIINDIKAHIAMLAARLSSFAPAVRMGTLAPDEIIMESQDIVSGFASFLCFVADLHVARRVDIDGIKQDPTPSPTQDLYMKAVNNARSLVRTLELAIQSLYDDSALLLLAAQHIRAMEFLEIRHNVKEYGQLEASTLSLKNNSALVQQTLEGLMTVGLHQAELAQGDYTGSIEWRMSRVSIIESALRPPSIGSMVDMELAFSKPTGMKLPPLASTASSSTLYRNASESSIDMSDNSRSLNGDAPLTPTTWDTGDPSNTLGDGSPEMSRKSFEDDDDDEFLPKAPARSKKLLWLVGEEAPSRIIQQLDSGNKPWFLRQDWKPEDIIIEAEGGVKGGTLKALIERLTDHDNPDPKFNTTFLMTYKSFTTLDTLFELLTERFALQPPENIGKDLEQWTKMKKAIVQARVLNVFKSMLTIDDILEKEDYYILDRLKQWLQQNAETNAAAKPVILLIERTLSGDSGLKKTPVTVQPPPPILPKTNNRKLKLMDIDAVELARQLCIMESQLYQKIRPQECLTRSREQKTVDDNITAVIKTANRMANWLADCVLSREDSRKRAAIVKHFINVADRCRMLHNFSSMVAIVSGLNTPHIRRLKRTWEQVNARTMGQLSLCESLIDSTKNFSNYRRTLEKVTPPCVPFFGTFITTLTFIQDGNPDLLPGGLINFSKRQKAADIMGDIRRWQHTPYSFLPVPTILAFIEESLNSFADDEALRDHFWNMSMEREPREREDEKMARLLQESGFL